VLKPLNGILRYNFFKIDKVTVHWNKIVNRSSGDLSCKNNI
jgi:hypothetical protein